MVDLVILLIISIAVMAALGVLVAGFVWVPWLIGLVLVVLLVALMRLAGSSEQQLLAELEQTGEAISSKSISSEANTAPHTAPEEANHSVMHYRGVKYKRTEPLSAQLPTSEPAVKVERKVERKYRGHPWKPSA